MAHTKLAISLMRTNLAKMLLKDPQYKLLHFLLGFFSLRLGLKKRKSVGTNTLDKQ
jgi:hypothetical protein